MSGVGALAAIGRTPLVELQRIRPRGGGRILVKLEYLNPTGAMKDRLALAMIEGAERDGLIGPKTHIVEYTGGSTGPGLAFVCALKGYRLTVVTSRCFSDGPRQLMEAFGADVELLDAAVAPGVVTPEDHAGMVQRAQELAAKPGVYFTDQFNNPYAVAGFRKGLGREIADAVGGQIDAFTTGVGSSASLLGVAGALRDAGMSPKVVALEPAGSPVLSGGTRGSFAIQGWSGFAPPLYDETAVDAVIAVHDEEATEMAHDLAQIEGIFTGLSGGANVVGAMHVAEMLEPGATVVTLAADSGYKYLK